MEREDAQNILRDVVNEDVRSAEDEDFALAKMMQDQERAFYHARNIYGQGENDAALSDWGLLMDDPEYAAEPAYGSGQDEEAEGSSPRAAPFDEDGYSAEEVADDEDFARRLHAQEQLDHQRRLMELAGVNPDGEEQYSDEEEEEGYLTDDLVDPDEMTYEELRALGDAVGVVSRGASIDIIKALPFSRYSGPGKLEGGQSGTGATALAAATADPSRHEEQCVVCRMEFESGEDVKVLPCKHEFHPDCIDQWLMINKACPICSSEVTVTAAGPSAKERAGSKPCKSQPHSHA